MLLSRASFVAIAMAAVGCSPGPTSSDAGPDAPHGCTTGFVGDPTKDPEIAITVLGTGTTATPVTDGDMVPLIFPPQGGRVIFAGARARNVDACGAQITGAVRDKQTKQLRLDGRTVNLVPADDGWLETDPTDYASFSNIPVCPNQWSATNIYGTVYELQITIVDRDGRTATKTIDVTPYCAEPENAADCACICKGGYMLGENCKAIDGGADAGDGG